MRTIILFFLVFGVIVISENSANAQTQTDSIIIENNRIFKQNDIALAPRQLMKITKNNAQAYEEMKKAKANSDFSVVLGAAGGFLIGWPLGTALGGGEPQWYLAGIGAGLLFLTIPLANGYKKHARNAVDIYNSGLGELPDTAQRKVKFDLGITSNGLGLVLQF